MNSRLIKFTSNQQEKAYLKQKNSNLKFVNLKTKFISYINDMTWKGKFMAVILLILAFIGGFVYCCFAKSLKKFAIRFAVFL